VAAHDGRVVKLIGDEVMYVAVDIVSACEIALGLTETFGGGETRIAPRGGLVAGDVVARGGDYYGSVVNLASRIAELAVPHEILVTDEVRERAEKAAAPFRFDPAGRQMLKGFEEPVELYAVSRL
jgi:adenylate cyclase